MFSLPALIQDSIRPFFTTTMSELKRSSVPRIRGFFKHARTVVMSVASLYTLAVVLVMTPFIQTQFRGIFLPFMASRN